MYCFVRNGPSILWDKLGLFCGECAPPSKGYPNYYEPKLVGIVRTVSGGNPFGGSKDLLASIQAYQTVINIINAGASVIKNAAQLVQFFAGWLSGKYDPSGYSASQQQAIDDAVQQFEGAMAALHGVNVYLEIEYRKCVECSRCRHRWQTKKSYYQCLEGSDGPPPHASPMTPGNGTYGGMLYPTLTASKLGACMGSYGSGGAVLPGNPRLRVE